MKVTEEEIESAYRNHAAALKAHWSAKERLFSARAELLKARYQSLSSGEIDGRNEGEREAKARALLPELFEAVEAAEAEARRTELEAELARFDIYRVRTLLWFRDMSLKAISSSMVAEVGETDPGQPRP